MDIFEPFKIGHVTLRNRFIRSGTYAGRSDRNGYPLEEYARFYEALARNDVGGIITGFAYVSKEGRAMQPYQAGIDHDDKIPAFNEITDRVHRHDCPIFLQIAHTGRQTIKSVTGTDVRGCSSKRSGYFRSSTKPFSTGEVKERVMDFILASSRAKEAGFDGIQVHAAHGYLIHQFIMPAINNRLDEYGLDPRSGIGTRFLEEILSGIRTTCGPDFPVLVKISGGIDLRPHFSAENFRQLILFLDRMKVDCIEISYGTMDYALSIFRGEIPMKLILEINPFYRASNPLRKALNKVFLDTFHKPRIKNYSPAYNLAYAREAKKWTCIPIISVGGFRNFHDIHQAISSGATDLVGLSRPLICEPAFVHKIKANAGHESPCNNCNYCSVMCDSGQPTQCYLNNKRRAYGTTGKSGVHHQA